MSYITEEHSVMFILAEWGFSTKTIQYYTGNTTTDTQHQHFITIYIKSEFAKHFSITLAIKTLSCYFTKLKKNKIKKIKHKLQSET